MAEVIERLLTAGNGIGSACIGLFGPGVFTEWAHWDEGMPADQIYAGAREAIQELIPGDAWYPAYEMWQMWYACMSVARELRAEEVTA